MAKQVLKNVAIYYGKLALASQLNQIAVEASAPEVDATTFDTTGYAEIVAGLLKSSMKFDGFWDAAATTGDPDASSFGQIAQANWPATVVKPASSSVAVADVAYFMKASEFAYTLGGQVGAVRRLSLSLTGVSALLRGRVADTQTAVAASGNGTAQQLAAVAAGQKLYCAVHVVAAAGTLPTLDLVVESDNAVGMATPTTRLTIPQFTGTGTYFGTVDGPITDDYFRIVRTVGGTGPSFTYLVALGIF